MLKQMNDSTKIIQECLEALEKVSEEKSNIDHKLTKENFENFLERINSNNKLDVEDYLIEILRKGE